VRARLQTTSPQRISPFRIRLTWSPVWPWRGLIAPGSQRSRRRSSAATSRSTSPRSRPYAIGELEAGHLLFGDVVEVLDVGSTIMGATVVTIESADRRVRHGRRTAVTLAVDDGVATITLDRPEQRNGMTGEMVAETYAALHDLRARTDVRVVVLTGAGDRFFCPGADLDHSKRTATRRRRCPIRGCCTSR